MTPAETAIREALAAGPTPGRWMHLPGDRFVYDRMEDGCRGVPVVGVDHSPAFFDQPAKNLDYVAACNPAALAELLAELDKLRTENEALREQSASFSAALEWYADGLHFDRADPDAWDTVSGEPQNWWCDDAGTATVEDGSLARMVLDGELTGQQLRDEDALDAAIDAAKGGGNG